MQPQRPSGLVSPSSRSAGVGIGIGNIFSALVTSVARNPSARDQVFGLGILGFALTEAVALFALLIAFLILFT